MTISVLDTDALGVPQLGNGTQFRLVSGLPGLQQRVRNNLNFFQGRSTRYPLVGLRVQMFMGRKDPAVATIARAEVSRAILGTEGIRRLRQITSTLNAGTRRITIGISAESTDGPFVATQELGGT